MISNRVGRLARAVGLIVLLLVSCKADRRDETPGRPRLAGTAEGRNVILISLDTLRADRLGSYGYQVQGTSPSPRIDGLLAKGTRFANAHGRAS